MADYEPKNIEEKWQKRWREEGAYEPDLDSAKRPFFNLMMFPYPSAEGLHVGNMYAFTGSDIYGRMKRMQGYDVFEPIGLDGFGIHSENYAMKIGAHPMDQALVSEARFYGQLEKIGNGFAWNERLETYKPEYYKWTQWIFAEMFRRGLAYRKKQTVNWCPKDLTVLADEQVENGKCERCGTEVVKRDLEQWFFKITDYADRLLANIDALDWSEKVKVAQKNWIGKSEGAEIEFRIKGQESRIKIFTTRPDTLFGVTFLVVSPEMAHAWMNEGWDAPANVKKYLKESLTKSDVERSSENQKEKTGEFTGRIAINPVNQEEIPIWIADYVLGSYGTGAIMAVPAHDERDFAFAKKFSLPIRQVVMPHLIDKENPPQAEKQSTLRTIVHCVVKHPTKDEVIALKVKKYDWLTPITGGVENGESSIEAGLREIHEETGYKNARFVRKYPWTFFAEFYAGHKDVNRAVFAEVLYFELEDLDRDQISVEESEKHEVTWIPLLKADSFHPMAEAPYVAEWLRGGERAFGDLGKLMNSGRFDGMDSETAKWEITKFAGGERKTKFRLRDWLISRQRYWGPPIPMIFCEACAEKKMGEHVDMPGWYAVTDADLPVLLPRVANFRPTGSGVSPLATEKSFFEVPCPKCGALARRETDVSDTFLDSAWYYLRYLSDGNQESGIRNQDEGPFDEARVKKWLPAEMYIGGAEHSVLHLLYVRFIAMVLHDWKLVEFEEPFKKFRAHGLLIKDGMKMSKSKGNVVNPDDYITNFGADTLRMHLMFLAPFEQGGDFRDSGALGIERFLKRVWKLVDEVEQVATDKKENAALNALLHKTIKKVTEDIENLHYNTSVSALMILLRALEDGTGTGHRAEDVGDGLMSHVRCDIAQFEIFLKLLAPFAPHITEEIWRGTLGHANSIHRELWPVYDPALVQEETFTLVLQVNSKTRDTMEASVGITEDEAKVVALASEKIKQAIGTAKPKKIIYVSGRLVNVVT